MGERVRLQPVCILRLDGLAERVCEFDETLALREHCFLTIARGPAKCSFVLRSFSSWTETRARNWTATTMGKKKPQPYGQGKSSGSQRKREFTTNAGDERMVDISAGGRRITRRGSTATKRWRRHCKAFYWRIRPAWKAPSRRASSNILLMSMVAATARMRGRRSGATCLPIFTFRLDTEEDDADASDIVSALRQCNALVGLPPPLPPPKPGDPVLAVLEEDGEWHAAVVAEDEPPPPQSSSSERTILVRFLQWNKPQVTRRNQVATRLRD